MEDVLFDQLQESLEERSTPDGFELSTQGRGAQAMREQVLAWLRDEAARRAVGSILGIQTQVSGRRVTCRVRVQPPERSESDD